MKLYIKEALEKSGYSQSDAAEKLGINLKTFNGYVLGKHDPKSHLLEKIANLTGTSVDFLLGIEKEAPASEDAKASVDEARVDQFEDALLPVLVKLGFIHDGQDLSQADTDFLLAVLALLDAYFSGKRQST